MNKVFTLLSIALIASACHNVSLNNGKPGSGEVVQETQHMFAFGLAGNKEMNLKEICPSGVSRVEDEMTVKDAALSIVSVGIYTPRTVSVECVARNKPIMGTSEMGAPELSEPPVNG